MHQTFLWLFPKLDWSNEKRLAIGVKLAIARHAKLYGVEVIAHAKKQKIVLRMRN